MPIIVFKCERFQVVGTRNIHSPGYSLGAEYWEVVCQVKEIFLYSIWLRKAWTHRIFVKLETNQSAIIEISAFWHELGMKLTRGELMQWHHKKDRMENRDIFLDYDQTLPWLKGKAGILWTLRTSLWWDMRIFHSLGSKVFICTLIHFENEIDILCRT